MSDGTAPARRGTEVAGKIGVTLLCCYVLAVAIRIGGCYHPDVRPRDDLPQSGPAVGAPFPAFTLADVSGVRIALADLTGHPVVLALVPSLDWSPPSKARTLDLADAVAARGDVRLAVVLTAATATPRSIAFVREHRTPAYYLVDTEGVIERLGLQAAGPDGEPAAVSSTFVLDGNGVVLLRDVRRDPRTWLDPNVVLGAIVAPPPIR